MSYSLLEHGYLLVCQGVRLSDDWDQVDLGVQSSHDLNVEWLQRVACRLNEIDTCMNTVVDDVHAVDLILCLEICIESLLNVLNDWSPGIVVVDKITKAGCVDNGQSESDTVLFNIRADRLYGYSLWDDIKTGPFALSWRIEGGVEEGVDQC